MSTTSADGAAAVANIEGGDDVDDETAAANGGSKTAGVLDKAIARIHKIAEARGTSQVCV